MNREVIRVVGDALAFGMILFGFVYLSIIYFSFPTSYSTLQAMSQPQITTLIMAGVLLVVAMLLGIYIQRAIFYYLVKPGTLHGALRWFAKGAVLYIVDALLLLVAISSTGAGFGFGITVLASFVGAIEMIMIQAIGDYIVFRLMAATVRRAR